jgi:hypothetical protein
MRVYVIWCACVTVSPSAVYVAGNNVSTESERWQGAAERGGTRWFRGSFTASVQSLHFHAVRPRFDGVKHGRTPSSRRTRGTPLPFIDWDLSRDSEKEAKTYIFYIFSLFWGGTDQEGGGGAECTEGMVRKGCFGYASNG